MFGYIFTEILLPYGKKKDMNDKIHKLTVAVTTRVFATGFYGLSFPPSPEFAAAPVIYLLIRFGALIFPC